MSFQVRVDSEKNILYITLGVMDREEISRFHDEVLEAVEKLAPGFGCINDVRSLRIPVERIDKEDLDRILHIHRTLRDRGVKGIVRVAESQVWLTAALAESEMISGVNIAYVDDIGKAESYFHESFEGFVSPAVTLVKADIVRNRLYLSFMDMSEIDSRETSQTIIMEASLLKPGFGCILDIRFLKADWQNISTNTIDEIKSMQLRLKKMGMGMVVRVVDNRFWLENLSNRSTLDPDTWIHLTLGEGQIDAGYKASFATSIFDAELLLDSNMSQ